MVWRQTLWALALLCAWVMQDAPACAAGSKTLLRVGDALTVALPVAAVGATLLHDDYKGLGEFALSAGLTIGSAYALNRLVREQRPDLSSFHSFSPPQVAIADSSAGYLFARYGWRYGIPAVIARSIVSYAWSNAKKTHWYDTVGTGALAAGFNYALVTRYHHSRIHAAIMPEPDGASFRITMNF